MAKEKRIYLDYAASTPPCAEALKETERVLENNWGNPGSLHKEGRSAIAELDRARQNFSEKLGVNFRDILFTSSASEANNLVILGAAEAYRAKHRQGGRIIISSVEHDSIRIPSRALLKSGFEIIEIKPAKNGVIDHHKILGSVNKETFLISVIYANNEIGSVQPVKEIALGLKEGKDKPLLHTDASQALQFIDCSPQNLGADLITLSSQKIYGPRGAGALILPEKIRSLICPQILGGHQEWGIRSGTENVSAIAGFSAALSYIYKNREKEAARINKLKCALWEEIKKNHPSAGINGPLPKNTLPHILNIRFPKVPADALLSALDMQGISASAGSACAMRSPEASPTLLSMGLSETAAKESIRFSIGRPTSSRDIKTAALALRKVLKLLY
jgi:cysteine desulfurase